MAVQQRQVKGVIHHSDQGSPYTSEAFTRRCFATREEARGALLDGIEGWYNTRRRHSSLGYQSLLVYERTHRAAA